MLGMPSLVFHLPSKLSVDFCVVIITDHNEIRSVIVLAVSVHMMDNKHFWIGNITKTAFQFWRLTRLEDSP
jgi:hypothetical protein